MLNDLSTLKKTSVIVSGVTESLFGVRAKMGGTYLHLGGGGGGARGRYRNEGCTIKSRMGGGGGAWCVWGAMAPRPPIVTPLVIARQTKGNMSNRSITTAQHKTKTSSQAVRLKVSIITNKNM